jgi:hypothetical protein
MIVFIAGGGGGTGTGPSNGMRSRIIPLGAIGVPFAVIASAKSRRLGTSGPDGSSSKKKGE